MNFAVVAKTLKIIRKHCFTNHIYFLILLTITFQSIKVLSSEHDKEFMDISYGYNLVQLDLLNIRKMIECTLHNPVVTRPPVPGSARSGG